MAAPTSDLRQRTTSFGRPVADALGIALLAFLLRFGIVLFSKGGPGGIFGYDSGVYYSAADALIHGRVPYEDFVFLHPPAVMLVLTPFAALGRLTTDHAGYVVANLFFNAIAAANAVLVWLIARRWGLDRRAAALGGLFYAVWWGAINAEIGVRLEPLGSLAFLLGIVLLAGENRPGRARAIGAGAALGVAVCTKIWWVVPLLIVVGWYLARRPTRRVGGFLALGAAAASTVIAGPFFVLAGSEMWHRVVTDQLGRRYHTQPYVRIQYLGGLRKAFPALPTPLVALAVFAIAVVFVAMVAVAWRRTVARMVVAVLVAQFLVLMLSPSFFNFYGGYVAGALALTAAAAVPPVVAPAAHVSATRPSAAIGRLEAWAAPAAAFVVAAVTVGGLVHSRDLVDPFPGERFERATAGLRCVMTDSNSALILMNRLSEDLGHGCPNWIDVTGHTYFGPAKSDDLTRAQNPRWQADLRRYLLSGDAVVVVRAGTGMSKATARLIANHPVLARGDGYAVYAVRSGR